MFLFLFLFYGYQVIGFMGETLCVSGFILHNFNKYFLRESLDFKVNSIIDKIVNIFLICMPFSLRGLIYHDFVVKILYGGETVS